jgi:hypothetical protein
MLTLLWQSAEVSIPTPLLTVPTVFKTGPEAALGNAPSILAERMGFEPTERFNTFNTLAGCRLRPLGHLSVLFW